MKTVKIQRNTMILNKNQYSILNTDISKIDSYIILEQLASNTGESDVFHVKKDDKDYVLKLYKKNINPKKDIVNFLLSHNYPQIIKIIETGTYDGRYYEILPYYKNGDLTKHAPLDIETLKKEFIPKINKALKIIHDNNLIHRDIKPNNIFLGDDNKTFIIGDFGISSILEENQTVRHTTTVAKTIGYSSPEMLNEYINIESDYYSLGVTLIYLIKGEDPFKGMTMSQIISNTINHPLPLPGNIDEDIKLLIQGLTIKDRCYRWGYDKVKRWCEGEKIYIDPALLINIRPFKFNNKNITSKDELSKELASSWDNAIKLIENKYVSSSNFAKDLGEDYRIKFSECEKEKDKEIGLFKLIYVLNPKAPIFWRGHVFNNIIEFTNTIINSTPQIKTDCIAFIKSGALSRYLEINKDKFENTKEIIDEINRLIKINHNGILLYSVYFLLNPDALFYYENTEIRNINELFDYLSNNIDRYNEIVDNLIKNNYFKSFINYLGYGDIFNNYFKGELYEWA